MILNDWLKRTEYKPTPEEWRMINDCQNFYSMLLNNDATDEVPFLFNKYGMPLIQEIALVADTVNRYKMFIQEAYQEMQTLYNELANASLEAQQEIKRKITKQKQIIDENQESLEMTYYRYRRLVRLSKKPAS